MKDITNFSQKEEEYTGDIISWSCFDLGGI